MNDRPVVGSPTVTDAIVSWTRIEVHTPESRDCWKKIWRKWPQEMTEMRMFPADHFDEAVSRKELDKEDRAKLNCGTETCNGKKMCDDHYRQFVGVYD